MTSALALRMILLFLHIALAALWLGPPLGLTKTVARGLASGQESLRLAVIELKFRGMLATIGGFGVFVTGFALIFAGGGFSKFGPQFHAAIGLVTLAIANSFFFRPLSARVAAAAENYTDANRADAARAIRRMSIHSNVQHLFWTASLVLMLWPR
jgi:hypothetical protein